MRYTILLAVAAIIFAACGEKKLTADQAITLLKKDRGYPKAYTFEINRIDPVSVQRLADAGLDTAGMVTLNANPTIDELPKPKIFFTEKAKPFLTGPPNGKPSDDAENVKVADMDITAVNGIATSSDGKTAKVDYEVSYTNLTPFQVLIKRSLKESEKKQEYFRLFDDGWRVDKTAESNMN